MPRTNTTRRGRYNVTEMPESREIKIFKRALKVEGLDPELYRLYLNPFIHAIEGDPVQALKKLIAQVYRINSICKRQNLKNEITLFYLIVLTIAQKGKDFYNPKRSLDWTFGTQTNANPYGASVDRVRAGQDYVRSNSVLSSWGFNRFKGQLTPEELKAFRRLYSKKSEAERLSEVFTRVARLMPA